MKTVTKPMRTREFILCLNCDHTFDGDTGEKVSELPDDSSGVLRGTGCCRECQTPLDMQRASLLPPLVVATIFGVIAGIGLVVLFVVNR